MEPCWISPLAVESVNPEIFRSKTEDGKSIPSAVPETVQHVRTKDI